MREVGLSRRMAEVARTLQAEVGPADTMNLAVRLALDVIEGAEAASLSLVHRGRIVETPAATSEQAFTADRIQQDIGSGPLLADVWEREVIASQDLAADGRWAAWGPRLATELGIRSVLCFRMFAARQRLGAISLYASDFDAFSGADVDAGIAFAAHTAIAVEVAREDENKDLALDSRSLIGQATGIVMERYDIDAVRAFGILKRISQDTNTKIHEVAAELIRTRALPE